MRTHPTEETEMYSNYDAEIRYRREELRRDLVRRQQAAQVRKAGRRRTR